MFCLESLRLKQRSLESRTGRRTKSSHIDAHWPRFNQGRLRLEWSLGVAATLVEVFRDRECRIRVWVLGTRTVRTTIIDAASKLDWLTFLAEATTGPHRELELGALDGIDELEDCYWLPAGGYRAPEDRELRRGPLHVLDGGQS